MAMREKRETAGWGVSQPRLALDLMCDVCDHAAEIYNEAGRRGETISTIQLFERAMAGMECSREDLLALWTGFMSGWQAAMHSAKRLPTEP